MERGEQECLLLNTEALEPSTLGQLIPLPGKADLEQTIPLIHAGHRKCDEIMFACCLAA